MADREATADDASARLSRPREPIAPPSSPIIGKKDDQPSSPLSVVTTPEFNVPLASLTAPKLSAPAPTRVAPRPARRFTCGAMLEYVAVLSFLGLLITSANLLVEQTRLEKAKETALANMHANYTMLASEWVALHDDVFTLTQHVADLTHENQILRNELDDPFLGKQQESVEAHAARPAARCGEAKVEASGIEEAASKEGYKSTTTCRTFADQTEGTVWCRLPTPPEHLTGVGHEAPQSEHAERTPPRQRSPPASSAPASSADDLLVCDARGLCSPLAVHVMADMQGCDSAVHLAGGLGPFERWHAGALLHAALRKRDTCKMHPKETTATDPPPLRKHYATALRKHYASKHARSERGDTQQQPQGRHAKMDRARRRLANWWVTPVADWTPRLLAVLTTPAFIALALL